MDEDLKNEFEEKEEESEVKKVESDIETGKKSQEITRKKQKTFSLDQSKDSSDQSSEWGSFRIRSAESLEISDNESFYRTPLTNIIENEKGYFFLVELPGLDKRHVNITLQEDKLEILGEKTLKYKEEKDEKKKKEKKEDKEKDKKDEKKDKHKEKKDKKKEKDKDIKGEFLRREYRSASYYRSFILPEEINSDDIEASYKNGILRLKIPKKTVESTDKKTIEIK
ncbi:MAG: Hsp20/alpha crystallin family protein [Promethearchaeota archaeon]|jgi:HSP20 family protein